MIRIFFVFIALGIGLFLGTQYAGQQGYVLISLANYTIEMSVTTLVIFVIGALVALFLAEFLIKRSLRASSATWNWFSNRKLKKARRLTNEGIIKLIEGDWQSAEKKVTRWSNSHDMPLLCYLVAAEAAHELGKHEKRDKYFELAAKQKNSDLAIGLTKGKQAMAEGDFASAFDVLSSLKAEHPDNPRLLNLLKVCYVQLNCWQPLLDLLPILKKAKGVSKAEHHSLLVQAHAGRISELSNQQGVDGIIRYWDSLSKSMKAESQIVVTFTTELIGRGADNTAITVLKEATQKSQQAEILNVYPTLNITDWHSVLKHLKGLEKRFSDNADIHSVIGQILMLEAKWADAQGYFESALKIRPSAHDYGQLANALHQQNYTNAANDVSQKALLLLGK
ncbi:heme biosynthesis protein HemY [Vibrio sp. UCD-FRSSP16_10]|uniref:heme biosynthesis protein HemY n=1 Tax=unclassified Vibrio TaxID=2614977 RepID=UPI0007FE7929|nr:MULTISPECIES: heme biosynthesis HemY N-terminal domain-containing protein [unclassified Vibrio]OBT10213.1 heme biosynthesis protein HemY [Vibrio sp. UCD-FRSSP16_30]OBT19003.1 heme biosynthesis protein HemY [Vibrio sp. UCD-FRSSP16_10]